MNTETATTMKTDTAMENKTSTKENKSLFINVLAWIFIVIGGFATFISILQNITIHMMFSEETMNTSMSNTGQADHIPAFAKFMFNNFELIFLLFMFFSLAILSSAIALLKRKNWARIFFIVVMSLGIIWNISGLAIQFTIFNSLPEVSGESIPASFQNMMLIMKTASVIMAIGLSILFGYIIKKLCSRQIRTEFV
jgi:hypothetical protein